MKQFLFVCAILGSMPLWGITQTSVSASFSPPLPFVSRPAMAWEDYDLDGDMDLFLSGIDTTGLVFTKLLKNTGSSFVPDPSNTFPPLTGASAAWSDFDGDGDGDLVICGLDGLKDPRTLIYRNDGGVLVKISHAAPGLTDGKVIWADFDRDGDDDLFLCGHDRSQGYRWLILENFGNGSFAPYLHTLPYQMEVYAAATGDVDGDGWTDLALAGLDFPMEGRVEVLRNFGQFQFAPLGDFVEIEYQTALTIADLDGDQKGELLVAGSKAVPLSKVYGLQNGQVILANDSLRGLSWGDVATLQIPGDPKPTLVISGRNATGDNLLIYRPDVNGNYVLQSQSGLPALFLSRLSIADWDGDGNPDILIAGENAEGVARTFLLTYDNGEFKP